MAVKTSYSHARENLATLWDEVEDSARRPSFSGAATKIWRSFPPTNCRACAKPPTSSAPPANAARLLAALARARRGRTKPMDLAALRRELGVAP